MQLPLRTFPSCSLLFMLLLRFAHSNLQLDEEEPSSCKILCRVLHPEVLVEEGAEEAFPDSIDCLERRRRRPIPLLLEDTTIFPSDALEAGTLQMCVSDVVWTSREELDLNQSKWTIVDASSTVQDHHRSLQRTVLRRGVKSLLAVRVVADGVAPQEKLSDMEATIFGIGSPRVEASVVSQYDDMSHGALKYVPYQNPAVRNGVLELNMPRLQGVNVQGQFTDLLLNRTRDVLLGTDSTMPLDEAVDTIIFCLPDGGLFKGKTDWTAFTYLFEPFSYYQRQRCTRLSVGTKSNVVLARCSHYLLVGSLAVHELGHSLGFQHSGVDDNIYADKTGYMGYAVNQVGAPLKSFNAHKHWISGWFQTRQASVNPFQDGTQYLRLVGFVDAGDPRLQEEDVAVIRVLPYLYLHFNVARSYNRDTDYPDTVTIVEAMADDKVSTRKAELARPGDSYSYAVSETWRTGVVIEICSIVLEEGFVSQAMVSVHVEGADSACDTDVDVWSPNWNEPTTPAPAPVTVDQDFDFFDGTPEDNDGSKTNQRLTLQPATSPIDTPNPADSQRKPTIPLSPWTVPSAAPVDWPLYNPRIPAPTNGDIGGAIDEVEEKNGNSKLAFVVIAGGIGGLCLLGTLVVLSIRSENMPLYRPSGTKDRGTSQEGTDIDGSSAKSSSKDQDVSETEIDDWWGEGWFNFDCRVTEETV